MDLVIAGAGMAGLSAALAATQDGARVTVIDKAARPGGNANLAAGMLLSTTDADALHDYIPDGDPALQTLLARDIRPAIDWLAGRGLPFADEPPRKDFRFLRPMAAGRPGDRSDFMRLMAGLVEKAGGTIRCGTAMRGLARSADGFEIALSDGSTFGAKAVILATGGFQAGREMLARYLGDGPAASLRVRSIPETEGDGLEAALALGAATGGDMAAFYGHSMADHPFTPTEFQPMTPYFARDSMLVNRTGRRFCDESEGYLEETNPQEGCRQPGGVYFMLFDRGIYEASGGRGGRSEVVQPFDWLERAAEIGAPLYQADTPEALAAALEAKENIRAGTLVDEIATYNRAMLAESGASLDPPRPRGGRALTHPPYYAMRCVAGITGTCGGIRIDDHARVLDTAGQPIAGLYAAGTDVGGVFGRHYGGFLGWALVSGRTAGRDAAAFAMGR